MSEHLQHPEKYRVTDKTREICSAVLGKREDELDALFAGTPFHYRIRMKDGKGYMGTCDHRVDRINIYVENGIITKTSIG